METKAGNLIKRVVVILIVFSMMLLNGLPILSNISLAAEDPETQVEVNGYFSLEGTGNTNSLVCDVGEQTLKINFDINVKGDGYLKNGSIKFGNSLNFKLDPDENTVIKDNQLKLPEINTMANMNVSIPVKFEGKEKFKLQDLSKTNIIVFKGEYVDNEGFLHAISKELKFELTWKEETSSNISVETIKNLDFEKDGVKGKIFQTRVKLSGNVENKLPIKSTEIIMDIPQVPDLEFAEAKVDVDKLLYTQGLEDFNSDFSDANYRVEEGKIIINVENKLIDEKLVTGTGEDSYILTLVYNGETAFNEAITSNVIANIVSYTENVENKESQVAYNPAESVGEAVQFLRENKEAPISKGYLIANSNQDNYEMTYVKKDILSVNRADLVNELKIEDVDEYFVDVNGQLAFDAVGCAFYKRTEFSRENLVSILGEEGKVQILNMNDEVINEITFDMEADEENKYVIDYAVNIPNIKIRFSKPIADGNISIVNTKFIKSLDYSRDEIKLFDKLISHAKGYATYNEGIVTELGMVESIINISNTSSGATMDMAVQNLTTANINEGINLQLRLNNNEDTSDLYENPVFEVRLPEVIKEVNIKNIDLFYANGELEIASVETFVDGENQVIRVALSGTQVTYGINKQTNGTVISLDLDLKLDELANNGTADVQLYYYNQLAIGYDNSVPWSMVMTPENEYLTNGSSIIPITYVAPVELKNVQSTELQEPTTIEETEEPEDGENQEAKEKILPTKQGATSELLTPGEPAKLATMYITVMNNTRRDFNDFKILGRIPFIGNTDVVTGEDLGTTVDTILDSEFRCMSDVGYTIYYSENPYATDNLYDDSNNWKNDYYKSGAVKSYLIVFNEDYVLKANTKIEFEYDYVIPANLKEGDAFYGTYATFFKESVTQIAQKDNVDKTGYETPAKEMASVAANITIKNETIRENSTMQVEVNVSNISEIDIENMVCSVPFVGGISASNIEGDIDGEFKTENNSNVLTVPLFPANTEKTIIFEYNIYKLDLENIKATADIYADNLEKLEIASNEKQVEKVNVSIIDNGMENTCRVGRKEICSFYVGNVSDEILRNLEITKTFSDKISIVESDLNIIGDFNATATYDESTGILKINIPELPKNEGINLFYKVALNDSSELQGSEYLLDIKTTITSENNIANMEYSKNVKFDLVNLDINYGNNSDVGFVSENEEFQYEYEITNNGNFELSNIKLLVDASDSFETKFLEVEKSDDKSAVANVESLDKAPYISLKPGETAKVVAKGKVLNTEKDAISAALKLKVFEREFSSKENYNVIEKNENDYKVTGVAFIDTNKNQKLDGEEKILSGIIVDLYDSETNEKIASDITDVSGRYMFSGLRTSKYFVKFRVDEDKYRIGSENLGKTNSVKSDVIKVNDDYVSDSIKLENKSVSGINLGMNDDNIFDLALDAKVEKMTIQNHAENNEFLNENFELAKVDIDPNLVNGSKVLLEYTVKVKNQGNVEGCADKIVDYLTDDLEFNSSLNPDWYMEADGNIYTRSLKGDVIKPGETRELKLILIKNMTDINTGLVHNSFEICASSNEKGIKDIDSIAGNRLEEDDLANADALIGISTGLFDSKIPIILTSILLLIPIAFLVWKKLDERRYV